jgi:HPt (histidine-containing phosphotransfer) domain-containing protein
MSGEEELSGPSSRQPAVRVEGVELDFAVLDRLVEWGGEPLRDRIVDLFLEHAPARLSDLRKGLSGIEVEPEASELMELAERSSHSLKSSAANLGAERVRRIAARIEEELREGRPLEAATALAELEVGLATVMAILRELRQEGG